MIKYSLPASMETTDRYTCDIQVPNQLPLIYIYYIAVAMDLERDREKERDRGRDSFFFFNIAGIKGWM